MEKEQQMVKDTILARRSSNNGMSVARDCRCDSIRHSTKYGCYSLLDAKTNKIIMLELVLVR